VLTKASNIQVEALIEVRRKRAAQLYDLCVRKLGEGAEKGKNNLSLGEKRGLKSLKKRVADGEIIVCRQKSLADSESYPESSIVRQELSTLQRTGRLILMNKER
jgi:hypothetical protein